MRTLIARVIGGEAVPNIAGTALILGRTTAEVQALYDAAGGATTVVDGSQLLAVLPPEWVKAGMRRAREAQAHLGTTEFLPIFRYWAERLGSAVEVDDDYYIWMVAAAAPASSKRDARVQRG